MVNNKKEKNLSHTITHAILIYLWSDAEMIMIMMFLLPIV